MEPQEIFDTVVNHLYKQGMAATDPDGGCYYRVPHHPELMCAVGCLIPDNVYEVEMDGTGGVSPLLDKYEDELPSWMKHNEPMLKDLQKVHDFTNNIYKDGTQEWDYDDLAYVLNEVARKYNLIFIPTRNK